MNGGRGEQEKEKKNSVLSLNLPLGARRQLSLSSLEVGTIAFSVVEVWKEFAKEILVEGFCRFFLAPRSGALGVQKKRD